MQYIRELRNGDRIPVSQEQYDNDRMGPNKGNLRYYMRTKSAVIYHMCGPKHRGFIPQPLTYGGRAKRQAIGFHA